MKLHENKELFQDAVMATAQQMGIPEIYVESTDQINHFSPFPCQ
ncbi:hypothetical protein [Zunongwangia pacifica]|nr:hypothetical protein [Zunongwangia pacifica]